MFCAVDERLICTFKMILASVGMVVETDASRSESNRSTYFVDTRINCDQNEIRTSGRALSRFTASARISTHKTINLKLVSLPVSVPFCMCDCGSVMYVRMQLVV